MKLPQSIIFLLLLVANNSIVLAQEASVVPGLSVLTVSNIRDSAIAFVNMSTSPGLEGAAITVDNNERVSDQWRSSLGFSADITLKDYIFNGYWGLAIVAGELDDTIKLLGDNGKTAQLDITRELVALRSSFGLSFPIDQHFKFRPYLSFIAADLKTVSTVDDQFVIDNNLATNQVKTSAELLSTVVSLDVLYNRWYGNYNLELMSQYNLINTDIISEDNPILDTEAINDTLQFKGLFTGPTNFSSMGRPWRWNTYANYTNFLSHYKRSLGYNSLFEIGTGLDWQINIKPLDWFGFKSLGIKAGVLIGDSVNGYSVGLTAR